MIDPAIEASRAQWRQYFQGGGRFDILYTLDEVMTPEKAAARVAVEAAIAIRSPEVAILAAWTASDVMKDLDFVTDYFGNPATNAGLGISGYGLHLPTLPALPWEHVAAIVVCNQLSAMSQARNGHILETPPVGNASTVIRGDFNYLTLVNVITTDAHATRALVPNPSYADVVNVLTTSSGATIGDIAIRLDPYLGPEQVVEFLFMMDLLTDDRGIKVYHVAETYDISETVAGILKLN